MCGDGTWCRLSESLSDRKHLHWKVCASQVEETGRAKGQGQEFLKQTGKEVGGQTALCGCPLPPPPLINIVIYPSFFRHFGSLTVFPLLNKSPAFLGD